MEYLVGLSLALGVSLLATLIGFDRDRAFYPIALIVIASYYDLFAIMSGSVPALGLETVAFAVFAIVAIIGFKHSLWLVAAALAGHGVFDALHSELISNPGVPAWWPMFCLTYDVAAASYLAVLLIRRRQRNPFVETELSAAAYCESNGDAAAAFRHLERAHVLGQGSTIEHVRVHSRMLAWGLRQRDAREIAAQILRIAGAATKTGLGLVPTGNTGGSNVSPFRALPIPDDLAAQIAVSKPAASRFFYAMFIAGSLLGLSAYAPALNDVRIATADGHRIAYRVLGTGQPVLVMIAGLGDGMESFQNVAPALAHTGTVIVYDRAGYGASAPAEGPRDAAAAERDLSALLAQSGVPGPYVLAGHSLGGLYAEYYAVRHPDQIAGLILEESRPAEFTRLCEAAKIGMCAPPALLTWFMQTGARAEAASLAAANAQVEAVPPLRAKPVLVLSRPSGGEPSPFDALWTTAQDRLAARYPGSRHFTARAGGHYLHKDQQEWFVAAVRDFLAQASAPVP